MSTAPRITANYSFWRHPIKWLKERRVRRIMSLYLAKKWPEMEPELHKAQMDTILYGGSFMDRNGKHVPFMEAAEKFYKEPNS